MTVALIGALLLLFGSLKVFVWLNRRLVARHQAYEATRPVAADRSSSTGSRVVGWDEPREKLAIFGN